MSEAKKVQPNFGLRAARRERAKLKQAASSQRVRAAAANFSGPEMDKYNELERQLELVNEKYFNAKQGMKVTV